MWLAVTFMVRYSLRHGFVNKLFAYWLIDSNPINALHAEKSFVFSETLSTCAVTGKKNFRSGWIMHRNSFSRTVEIQKLNKISESLCHYVHRVYIPSSFLRRCSFSRFSSVSRYCQCKSIMSSHTLGSISGCIIVIGDRRCNMNVKKGLRFC